MSFYYVTHDTILLFFIKATNKLWHQFLEKDRLKVAPETHPFLIKVTFILNNAPHAKGTDVLTQHDLKKLPYYTLLNYFTRHLWFFRTESGNVFMRYLSESVIWPSKHIEEYQQCSKCFP